MQGDKQSSPPPILPIVDTHIADFVSSPPINGSPSLKFSPTSPIAASSSDLNGGIHLTGKPSFRRHHRQRSSTIYIPARPGPPESPIEEAEVPTDLVRGVTTLAGAQVLAKLLTFVLNQVLIKFLGARELGLASQLELLVSTSLALSRDALRLASQRQSRNRVINKSEYTTDGRAVLGTLVGSYQETCNLGWLAMFLGSTVVTLISSLLVARQSWSYSVIVTAALAAVTELVTEPCFLILQFKLQLGQRAKAESLGNIVRVCVVAFALLLLHINPFLGFALGHLAYSITLAIVYYASNLKSASEDGFSILPAKVWISQDQHKQVLISEPLWKTSIELSAQQVVKYVLTEGDKLVVSVMTTLEEQGEYALAANYGSLLARLVFAPVEEALRGYFTKMCPKSDMKLANNGQHSPITQATQRKSFGRAPSISPTETISELRETYSDKQEALSVLSSVLRCYAYLGIFSAGFGPLAVPYLLNFIVRTSNFKGAASVLSAYAYYIPVMAWSGALEALVQSTAPLSLLRWQGGMMAGMALLFVVFAYLLVTILGLGGAGIVWSQVAVMCVRSAWSIIYATFYFSHSPVEASEDNSALSFSRFSPADFISWITQCLPNKYVTLSSLAITIGARVFIGEATSLKSLILLSSLAAIPLAGIVVSEKELIGNLNSKLHPKIPSKKSKEE